MLEVGDVLFSPIGIFAVTEFSVPRVDSLMMGGRFLGTTNSDVLAAQLEMLSAIEVPDREVLDIADALAKSDALFVFLNRIGIVNGLVVFASTPWILRRVHG